MDQIEKIQILLSRINAMRKRIRAIEACPFIPDYLKSGKVLELEASLQDAQMFAAVFMGITLEELQTQQGSCDPLRTAS